ncbi:MAG: 3-oxoacyl-ACP reductase [Geminicoccus sp.]|nr:3-oxoacyl-ACP reductase [Geminicoccus sp.]
MDLGISGKTAIVCASSKGLGLGCALALAEEGAHVVLNGRNADSLAAAQAAVEAAISAGSGSVTAVAADVTTPEGREALLAAAPNPDILINNAGGPPPGDFRNWSQEDWMRALNANLYSPVALIEATIDGMIERGFGRIVNITSAAVKAPIPHLGLSNAARTGLTGFVAGLARQVAAHNVTINNLLPGQHETERLVQNYEHTAKISGQSFEQTWNEGAARNPARRFGTAEEFGHACAFFCSARAGYITGQNLVLDGGGYPGTL